MMIGECLCIGELLESGYLMYFSNRQPKLTALKCGNVDSRKNGKTFVSLQWQGSRKLKTMTFENRSSQAISKAGIQESRIKVQEKRKIFTDNMHV